MYRLVGLLCYFATVAARAQLIPQPANMNAEDLAHGKRVFQAQCSPCHGIDGTGGSGANLAVPTLKHAANDAALFDVIQGGIAGTGMPYSFLGDREIWLLVAYVRSLGRAAVENLPGDAAKGRALFNSQGCPACHMLNGIGGVVGPDLSEVGARRSSQRLRQCLVDPGSALPDGFLMVRAVRNDGSVVEGMRVNEDSFSIQLRDTVNRFYSLRKQQMQTLDYEKGATPMPGYRDKLSATELDNLVAYLASLRGKQ
jgi:putative heme-binding domain-containing protein